MEGGGEARVLLVSAVIGAGGGERIIEIKLKGSEKTAFNKSVRAVEGLIDAIKALKKKK